MSKLETAFIRMQFGGKDRIRLYRKLVRFLRNGVPLAKALDMMWLHASEDGKKPKTVHAIVIAAWRDRVKNGQSLARAVQGWVPDKDRTVIEAGEAAGSLDVAIENAIFIQEGAKKIRTTLIAGLAYPLFLVAIAFGFFAMFGLRVVPAFEEVLPRERWTGIGAQMAIMSDFTRYYMIPALAVLLGVVASIVWSMPRWTGRARTFADRIPPWSLYRLTAGAGFMMAVAGMVKAGVAIPAILRTLQRDASPWYMERMSRTLAQVNNGHNLGDALYRTGFGFPDVETVKDLRAYAPLDGFDETLQTLAREWVDESVEKIQQQTGVLRNVSFILLGGVFGWIATGIFSLQQQITSSL